ncbi:hypothetical protein LCGC14_1240190 [marine sediment metagenome]|uniref:DUF1064 domain-containing protein n=1 Tax=marine sediment metagenome TaxID=412755 RepID=A0A0F9LA95_9ZZZZ
MIGLDHPYRRRKFSGRTSGANIPNAHVYICEGCQSWNNGKKPAQCDQCGSLAFTHFSSKAETKRYGELMLELRTGMISELELQPRFSLSAYRWDMEKAGGFGEGELIKIGTYVADFQYSRSGATIIEDVKGGADTPLSAWKRKHAEAQYGIKIQIVKR